MNNADIFKRTNETTDKYLYISKVLSAHEQLLDWRPEESVLDAGCGPGDVTAKVLLPWLPSNFRCLLGVDISPSLITHALSHHASDKVTFSTADIGGDVSHIIQDTPGFDKIFSFFMLHWLQDLENGVTNLYSLLRPGGQALLAFPVERSFQRVFRRIAVKDEWREHFKNVIKEIPPFLTGRYPRIEFEEMLSTAGFEILKCDVYEKNNVFASVEMMKDLIESLDPDINCIPLEQKTHYLDDCLKEMIDMGFVKVEENVTLKQTIMISVITKPEL